MNTLGMAWFDDARRRAIIEVTRALAMPPVRAANF